MENNRLGKYRFIRKKPRKFYCKRCAKKLDINIPTFEDNFKLDNENTCCWTNKKTNKVCGKKSKFVNLSNCYCNTHSKSIYKQYVNSSFS